MTEVPVIVVLTDDSDKQLIGDLENSIDHKVIKYGDILSDDGNNKYLYVLNDFGDGYFDGLRKKDCLIFGTPAMKQSLACIENMGLDKLKYPLHNRSMNNLRIAFTKLCKKDKDTFKKHLDQIRFMGASRRSMNDQKLNYLVAYLTDGAEYRTAVNIGTPIMSPKWVEHCWEQRFNLDFDATNEEVIEKFRLKPFEYLNLAFVNYTGEDLQKMEELTITNGGGVVQPNDPRCTHVVVNAIPGEHDPDLMLDLSNPGTHVVYDNWFGTSIQIGLRAEETSQDHRYPVAVTISGSENFADRTLLSPLSISRVFSPPPVVVESKRQRIVSEITETEANYIQILNVLVNDIQNEFINSGLLHEGQVKIVFGKLPEILKIHQQLRAELVPILNHWDESTAIILISEIFKKFSPKIMEKYSPYVNSLESGKEVIGICRKDDRFSELLKICESKPDCQRASLSDLLSRPFQRPFQIRLLLQRLLDDVSVDDQTDRRELLQALELLDKALESLNEKKRRTEDHLAHFADLARIKHLPSELFSATNQINGQVDARRVILSDRKLVPCNSPRLTLFILNDVLEVCKKRTLHRTSSMSRSSLRRNSSIQRSGSYSGPRPEQQPYKHIGVIEFSAIKTIEYFQNCPEYEGLFLLILRPKNGLTLDSENCSFRYLPFWVRSEGVNHGAACDSFLTKLALQLDKINLCSREILVKRDSSPAIDLRYSDRFFDKEPNSSTITRKLAKRFKFDSKVHHLNSPLFSKS
ncbi:epithelial cell transforming 2 pebble isoform X2 [Brevipalpus obovatus]|uniref:epithelial cell transforming 2 pebble isoform X2 n=1 Tax=Brevipalpus obovatus TaxID=246614 RepID=UPI003D9FA0EF